jgi:3-hydroxyacyl-CoA dehydrogenase/enoyl-CoA hydratase/3-hydroxybutyryl-CoA epimerase
MNLPATDSSPNNTVHLEIDENIASLTFDLPDKSVNVLSTAVMEELEGQLRSLSARNDVSGVILASAKKNNFIAGANVEEIEALEDQEQAYNLASRGQHIFQMIAELPFPSVAAINGTCLGGGLEMALACTYRVAADSSSVSIGLPEIRLGIIPGFGGTQRLPKIIGLTNAFDLIMTGKRVSALKALKLGLIDDIAMPEDLLNVAEQYLRGQLKRKAPKRPLMLRLLESNPFGRKIILRKVQEKAAQASEHYPATQLAITAIMHGTDRTVKKGLDFEARLCARLICSDVCKRLIRVFYLSESVKKLPAKIVHAGEFPIHKVGVVGAGVMGGGIAHLFAKRGLQVRLSDISAEPILEALRIAAKLAKRAIRQKRMTKTEAKHVVQRIRPTLSASGFGNVDLVIEAVVEKQEIKEQVLQNFENKMKVDSILATNTSSLSVNKLGRSLQSSRRLVGMHFFNPVDRMPLVEIIAGEDSNSSYLRAVYELALKVGKIPVLVKDSPGFLVNRLLGVYMREAMHLLEEGSGILDIDHGLVDFGMPMGPFELIDVVGLDIADKALTNLTEGFGSQRFSPAPVLQVMCNRKLFGKKSGSGFYHYDAGKKQKPNETITTILGGESREMSADGDPVYSIRKREIWERPVLVMLNEACYCLDENIVENANSVDLAMIMGAGFPPFRGGLMQFGASLGFDSTYDRLSRLADLYGERFKPHPQLKEILASVNR